MALAYGIDQIDMKTDYFDMKYYVTCLIWRTILPKKYDLSNTAWADISCIYEEAPSRKTGIKRVIEYIKSLEGK